MNLRETRIVVVDDKEEDAKKLLRLLNNEGVPYNYYYKDGDEKNLPKSPLNNVRLIFLDFVLGTDGSLDKNKISVLMNVLSKIVHKDNGPYIILAWTLHNNDKVNGDLITPFKKELHEDKLYNIPKPIEIIDLDKVSIMHNLDRINKKLKETFNGKNIFEVFLEWECNGHMASADVINTLTRFSINNITENPKTLGDFSKKVQREAEKNMYNFGVSVSGEKPDIKDNVLINAQLPLSGILQDRLESRIKSTDLKLEYLSKKICPSKSKKKSQANKYSDNERAQMNSYFLLDSEPEFCIKPGNIYKSNTILGTVHTSGRIRFNKDIFYESEKMAKDKRGCKGNSDKLKALEVRNKDFKKRIVPILVEITPECDYVQKNWKSARFIYGALWPYKFLDDKETAVYIKNAPLKIFSKLLVKYNNKVYWFLLHANHQCIVSLPKIRSVEPILRARKELLVDIQHWHASHMSRPGKNGF